MPDSRITQPASRRKHLVLEHVSDPGQALHPRNLGTNRRVHENDAFPRARRGDIEETLGFGLVMGSLTIVTSHLGQVAGAFAIGDLDGKKGFSLVNESRYASALIWLLGAPGQIGNDHDPILETLGLVNRGEANDIESFIRERTLAFHALSAECLAEDTQAFLQGQAAVPHQIPRLRGELS